MVVRVFGHFKECRKDWMPVPTAAILRVPRNNTPSVSNEKQVSPHEAAESNVGRPLLELETRY